MISIITPVYNREHTIQRCIESVLEQTSPYWEYLIVDDASTDDTVSVIHSYLSDKRIRLIRSNINQGNAGARNRAIKEAKYEIIAFLDSDDALHPTFISEISNIVDSSTDFAFGWTGVRWISTHSTKEEIWKPSDNLDDPYFFLKELKIGTGCGLFLKKNCFDNVGLFNENLRAGVDTEFLIRLRSELNNYHIIEKILIDIYKQEQSVRKSKKEIAKTYNFIIQKYRSVLMSNKGLARKWYYKSLWLNLHAQNYVSARKLYNEIRRLGLNSTKIKTIYLLFSILPNHWARRIHEKISSV
jgi:glycosyltransferase involved in cell wall biosynthesis